MSLAYLAGSPAFDQIRPLSLHEPLRGFHEDVTRLATDSVRFVNNARHINFGTVAANSYAGGYILKHVANEVRVLGTSR